MIPVVFVPSAPLLLPYLNPQADAAVAEVRQACHTAVASLAGCSEVVVIGSAGVGLRPDSQAHPPGVVRWTGNVDPDAWPFSAQVGQWLVGSLPGDRTVVIATVADDADAPAVASDVSALPPLGDGVGLLVVGDGTATRVEKSPGHVVAGAVALDDQVTGYLAAGDVAGLLHLDPSLDRTFLLDGRPAWHATAALLDAAGGSVTAAAVGYADAPHNVWYVVATWQVALPGSSNGQSDQAS